VVEVHNYRESLSVQRKKENWVVLNQKVLKKLGVDIGKDEIEKLCAGADKAAEKCAPPLPAIVDAMCMFDDRHVGRAHLSLFLFLFYTCIYV
jgi:hypothetical protein